MTRSLTLVACVALFLAGCTGGGTVASVTPGASTTSGPSPSAFASPVAPGASSQSTPSGAPPTALVSPSPVATATATPAEVPAGRILFHRVGSDGVERYFTINTDGTDEQALYTREGCACARWSADGTHVLTLDATGLGTFSFTTMKPDGSDVVTLTPPIETLNLAPGATSADGRWIAFDGWDETDPSRNGLYLGSPDLADFHRVTPVAEGTIRVEPFGVTPDGSQVLFFADRGDGPHPAGDLYVVNADGSGLRRLNPVGTTHAWEEVAGGSLSPDGRRVAFTVFDGEHRAVFVADLDSGEADPINDWGDGGGVGLMVPDRRVDRIYLGP